MTLSVRYLLRSVYDFSLRNNKSTKRVIAFLCRHNPSQTLPFGVVNTIVSFKLYSLTNLSIISCSLRFSLVYSVLPFLLSSFVDGDTTLLFLFFYSKSLGSSNLLPRGLDPGSEGTSAPTGRPRLWNSRVSSQGLLNPPSREPSSERTPAPQKIPTRFLDQDPFTFFDLWLAEDNLCLRRRSHFPTTTGWDRPCPSFVSPRPGERVGQEGPRDTTGEQSSLWIIWSSRQMSQGGRGVFRHTSSLTNLPSLLPNYCPYQGLCDPLLLRVQDFDQRSDGVVLNVFFTDFTKNNTILYVLYFCW